MEGAEAKIVALLKRVLGGEAKLESGSRGPKTRAWAQLELFVQLAAFEDFGGRTADGARTNG